MEKNYSVKIVRGAGFDLDNNFIEPEEEMLRVQAVSEQEAHQKAQALTSLSFKGQEMKVYIDGKLHLDERY